MTADSALPNGWRCASSPAPTRFPALRPHSRNFKRRRVAPHHKPLRRLRQVGTCPTAIRGGRAKRYPPLAGEGQKSACARSVRSSGARRGRARRGRANRNARRPAPNVDHGSCEWSASTLRCLPELHVPRWRDVLQLNEREPVGPECLLFGVQIDAKDAGSSVSIFSQRTSTARAGTAMSSPLRRDA